MGLGLLHKATTSIMNADSPHQSLPTKSSQIGRVQPTRVDSDWPSFFALESSTSGRQTGVTMLGSWQA